MAKPNLEKLNYEDKEKRLEEILERLDRSETPMDELASDAREASKLIKAMRATFLSAAMVPVSVPASPSAQRLKQEPKCPTRASLVRLVLGLQGRR